MKEKYLTMIRGMKRTRRKDWSVYILCCGDGSFYTGITKDVEARLKKHASGKGAAYTRSHLPVRLAYEEKGLSRSEALLRELEIKRLPRLKKEFLMTPRRPTRLQPKKTRRRGR